MKTLALTALLLFSVVAWPQQPNPADYPLTMHVVRSYLVHSGGYRGETYQELDVLVDGKKLQLEALSKHYGLFEVGNYKARLKQSVEEHGHFRNQLYEFLFPDNKRETFEVVGESE